MRYLGCFAMDPKSVLSSHADVVGALRDAGSEPGAADRALREEAQALFSPENLAAWEPGWKRLWAGRFVALVSPCDIIADLAAPVCLEIAAQVCGAAVADARQLAPVARRLFDAEADVGAAQSAALELMSRFKSGLKVQAFAALCHTLPAFLGNSWLALLNHPMEMAALEANPEILPEAIEELLRFAGPSTAVFRNYGDGVRVTLRLADANRDPEVFAGPNQLKFDRRRAAGHVAFGAGPHACAGAALIRLAAQPPILEFARRFTQRTVEFHAEVDEGLTLRSLSRLSMRF
jgi:cytochrome P450